MKACDFTSRPSRLNYNHGSLSGTVRANEALCSEIHCGASLLVTSCSCNYSLNIDPIGAQLVVVIRMYAGGH